MNKELKPKVVHLHNGILYDSREEILVAMWLDELLSKGLILSWNREVQSIPISDGLKIDYIKSTQLKTKTKHEKKQLTVLRPSVYTPDFKVEWTKLGMDKFVYSIYEMDSRRNIFEFATTFPKKDGIFYTSFPSQITILEVKPDFDQNNMTREFKLNQKFIWNKWNIFVNLIEPKELFEKTFMPREAMNDFKYKVGNKKKGKVKGDWTVNYIPKTIEQFLNT